MDKEFTKKIEAFLGIEKPTDEEIIEGAKLLLQCNPAHERGIYNSAMKRPQSMLPWVRTDLRKYLGIRKRGLTTPEVKKFNEDTIAAVRETLAKVPEDVAEEEEGEEPPSTSQLRLGKRVDHDALPADIQALWAKNSERWKKMRALHYQLSLLIAKPDYAPCDGNELCYQLRQLDTDLRNDYRRYDEWQPAPEKPIEEVVTDNVKTIQNARTAISRNLAREKQTEASLQKLQDSVNTLVALKQTLKPETIERLRELGISVDEQG